MASSPSFDDFYGELHGYPPLPWQRRLAHLVADTGSWPSDIGVPTGLGKTSTLSIAVWVLAADAANPVAERRAPRRIWYVVNRRLLVDAALQHALDMQSALMAAKTPAVRFVAEQLQTLGAIDWDCGPLHVARLRGGAEQGLRPPDPSCPSLILSTVPMFGSRLLFRGYGCSSGMRSIDAAHAGCDSLVLLDEAHLARPLQKVLAQREELVPPEQDLLGSERHRVRTVNLTATGSLSEATFDLDDADRAHPIVTERLTAAKPTELVSVHDRQVPAELAKEAIRLCQTQQVDGREPAVVVFVNLPSRAPEIKATLGKLIQKDLNGQADIVVLTGRLRPHDANNVRDLLLKGDQNRHIDAVKAGDVVRRDRPLFVVATQTLEVGADVDFDVLVTESAGVRSLTQRFGRLNRLGSRNWARACVVHANDKKDLPVYGVEPLGVWARLMAARRTDDTVDLSPGRINGVLGDPIDEPPPSPELLPNHLWEWAKTTLPRRGEPDVAPFISGIEEHRTITVVWRDSLPLGADSGTPTVLVPAIHPEEGVEIPVYAVREFLEQEHPDDGECLSDAFVLEYDGASLSRWTASELRSGGTVILTSSLGGYGAGTGWDPTSRQPVEDLSFKLRDQIVLTGDALVGLLRLQSDFSDSDADQIRSEPDNVLEQADQAQWTWSGSRWLAGSGIGAPDDAVDLAALGARIGNLFGDYHDGSGRLSESWKLQRVSNGPVVASPPRPNNGTRRNPRIEASDGLSLGDDYVNGAGRILSVHCSDVGEVAGRIASAVGFSEHIVQAVALAGRLHDVGKADPRFQALLGAEGGTLLAKSAPGSSGTRALWPVGARHEMVSGLLMDEWLRQAGGAADDVNMDLVRHLVLSHHGKARPLIAPVHRAGLVSTRMVVEGVDVKITSDLAAADWGQPARFHRLCGRYGYWGLALLEAVLRQADHAVSAKLSSADEGSHAAKREPAPIPVMEVL